MDRSDACVEQWERRRTRTRSNRDCMIVLKSFQRRSDPFCFRDHSKDRDFNIAASFAPRAVFEVSRQLNQARGAKMTAATLYSVCGRRDSGAISLLELQPD